jgi:hypothetical protein
MVFALNEIPLQLKMDPITGEPIIPNRRRRGQRYDYDSIYGGSVVVYNKNGRIDCASIGIDFEVDSAVLLM